jgi:hypothetical protein
MIYVSLWSFQEFGPLYTVHKVWNMVSIKDFIEMNMTQANQQTRACN